MQGGKIIGRYANMTGNMTTHEPIHGSLSCGLGLNSITDSPNVDAIFDAILISLHHSMDSHAIYILLVLMSTY